MQTFRNPLFAVLVFAITFCVSSSSEAQNKQLTEALKIKPKQKDVEFDNPTASELKDCKIELTTKPSGWVVVDGSGRILRKYVDTNGDKSLDRWSFYKDGLQVYTDIDSNFDNKTDQYRWVGMAGTRWGIDRNQDGEIDSWKEISAQEVAREVFFAYRDRDTKRFQRVLISPNELKSLELGDSMNGKVGARARSAAKSFSDGAGAQRDVSSKSRFSGFGTSSPGRIAGGTNGIANDLIIYDHAAAMFSNGNDFGQLAVGTIVQIGPMSWRAIEAPAVIAEGRAVANGGVFYQLPNMIAGNGGSGDSATPDKNIEKINSLWSKLEKLDKQINGSNNQRQLAAMEKEHASITMDIIDLTKKPEDRSTWIRALADRVANAYQEDRFADGLDYLDTCFKTLKENRIPDSEISYIKYRAINAQWSKGLDGDRRERFKASETYNKNLEKFVAQFPTSPFAAQAMSHLAMNYELSERDDPDVAISWYKKLAERFPETSDGRRARGALVRLQGDGKTFPFVGKTLNGKVFDISNSRLRGKVVLIHFWDTNCELCIESFDELKRLNAKYKDDLVIVGANLDTDSSTVKEFITKNRSVNWIQLWEDGGADGSNLVNYFGVTVVPTVFLVDQAGKLVESDIAVDDIEREIQRLTRLNRNAKRGN